MNITQIKVFGERNTGTNWLEDLLMKNYDISIIHHREIIHTQTTELEKKFVSSLPQSQQVFMQECINDSIFEYKAAHLFGWKHSAIVADTLKKHPKFEETGFIFLVKDPYTFIKSLHKRPYHALSKLPKNIDKFLETPWPTLRRDNINTPLLSTPIELWNYKVTSYLDFLEKNSNAILLRYESLLENHEYLFDVIEDKFLLKAESRLPIVKSTKYDRMNTNDYQKKYLKTSPSSGLNSASLDLMRSVLDERLMKSCQYSHPA
ncbi:hypothetical protein [Leptothoe spongobia]|uniref:Sulfotransferase domain-containing protein n=1 Tax=Leptothoe spongobia TAU-MAC 1115 TaxID=1967444 RepID=A0A947GKI9_9CYAN|nr:hypothetical protein [Leptothoe spongobia]MBT9317469.1 hypothetical protein [Leptothoe spongobia TAU-MAC 1115]